MSGCIWFSPCCPSCSSLALTCTISCLFRKLGAPWSSLPSFIVLTLLLLLSGLVCLPRPTRKFLNALRILHHWSQLRSPSHRAHICSAILKTIAWMFLWRTFSQPTNNLPLPPSFFYSCLTHGVLLSPPWNPTLLLLLLLIVFWVPAPEKQSASILSPSWKSHLNMTSTQSE